MIFKNLVTESSISSYSKFPVTTKEEVNMKKIVLIALLGLCSLVLADDTQYETDTSLLYTSSTFSQVSERQVECLAKNMYFEAKNEPEAGIRAVGFVTLNRVSDPHFPKTICEVVYQKERSMCQFSWVCSRGKNPKIDDPSRYQWIRQLASDIIYNYSDEDAKDPSKGSLFFHATYINPNWKLKKTVRIGQHVFYKRPTRKTQ